MAPQEQKDFNNFMMDLENWVLEHRWDARIGIPCGPRRFEDPLWALVMKEEIEEYPRKTWDEYCEWVADGGGDDWFQPSEPELPDQVNGQASGDLRGVGQTRREGFQDGSTP